MVIGTECLELDARCSRPRSVPWRRIMPSSSARPWMAAFTSSGLLETSPDPPGTSPGPRPAPYPPTCPAARRTGGPSGCAPRPPQHRRRRRLARTLPQSRNPTMTNFDVVPSFVVFGDERAGMVWASSMVAIRQLVQVALKKRGAYNRIDFMRVRIPSGGLPSLLLGPKLPRRGG